MAFIKRKRLLLLAILLIVTTISYFAFGVLFPDGPILDHVPNLITDKAQLSRADEEANIPINPLKNLYFGDLHVHTSLSFDAFLGGTIASPNDAYKFAKGETISVFGKEVKIRKSLDFSAVTDHSELMGEMYSIQNRDAPAYNSFAAYMMRSIYDDGEILGLDTTRQRMLFNFVLDKAKENQMNHPDFFRGYETTKNAWNIILKAAENHYKPGEFTTLAGFEWSYTPGAAHLHRNIIFRDMIVPDYPVSSLEARSDEELWQWMQQIIKEGSTVMAIPHNTNLSEGMGFPDVDLKGNPIDSLYAKRRQEMEPLIEVHQAKGNSEVHAAFWKNDEFADFENNATRQPLERDYVRYALKKGLEQYHRTGVNPFKFGMIGSTDTHSGTPGNVEENDTFISNHAALDNLPAGRRTVDWALDNNQKVYEVINPGGLVAVWAEANTRGQIYDALKRKEVYATSGSRIKLRFFGGNNFTENHNSYDEMLNDGYKYGVPMGSDLKSIDSIAPQFIIYAEKGADDANLDRIQIIKGWFKNGEMHEKIYNVALSDGRTPNEDGTVPDNGAIVNMETGEWSKEKGDAVLKTIWTDPDFDHSVLAFYYVRVLEVPTASWRLWDKIRYGIEFPDNAEMIVRERAWSSPIWYTPSN